MFDPLGFFVPIRAITLHGKLFLQKLWVAGRSWDEPIYRSPMSEWNQVLQLLIEIPGCKIPRFVKYTKSDNQLVIFCDALTKAYATVIYLKIKDTGFPTSFLFSKVRLIGTC